MHLCIPGFQKEEDRDSSGRCQGETQGCSTLRKLAPLLVTSFPFVHGFPLLLCSGHMTFMLPFNTPYKPLLMFLRITLPSHARTSTDEPPAWGTKDPTDSWLLCTRRIQYIGMFLAGKRWEGKSQISGVDLGRIFPFCNSRALGANVQVIVSPRTSVCLVQALCHSLESLPQFS